MRKNAFMIPHTVPNKPMNGEDEAMLESVGIKLEARCCSVAIARLATAFNRSELRFGW